MEALFLKVLTMSLAGGLLVLPAALLRLGLKRAPAWTRCLLWLLVALRLVLPFAPESGLSIVPRSIADGSAARGAASMLDGASEAGMHAAAGNTKPGMTGASETASDKVVQGASLSGQAAAGAAKVGEQVVSDASDLVEQIAFDAVQPGEQNVSDTAKPGEQNISGAAKPGAKTSAEGAGTP
ncbi:MAG: hypothetical protein IJM17_03230, partial [Firmicutes bacterium]|nr:hypothetical protein [Bacillota bacterium]